MSIPTKLQYPTSETVEPFQNYEALVQEIKRTSDVWYGVTIKMLQRYPEDLSKARASIAAIRKECGAKNHPLNTEELILICSWVHGEVPNAPMFNGLLATMVVKGAFPEAPKRRYDTVLSTLRKMSDGVYDDPTYVPKIEADLGAPTELPPAVYMAATPPAPFPLGTITLEARDLEKVRECEDRYGAAAARALRAELETTARLARLSTKSKDEVPEWVDAKVWIPKVSALPYMLLNLFFLLAAVYDAGQTARNFKWEEEELGSELTFAIDEEGVKRLITQKADLETRLRAAKETGDKTLQVLIEPKLADINYAISQTGKGSKINIGAYTFKLPAKEVTFKCREEHTQQVRSILQRWRMYTSLPFPTEAELEETEEYKFRTRLSADVFSHGKAEARTRKDELISSIINLRTVAIDKLISASAAINLLADTKAKITNVFKQSEWPEWVQEMIAKSKSLPATFDKIIKEAKDRMSKETLSKEDRAFWQASSVLDQDLLKRVLAHCGVAAPQDLPVVYKMAVIDSSNKVDKIEFLRQLSDGTINPADLYQVPEIKAPKKKSYADILKTGPKEPKAAKATFVSSELVSSWMEKFTGKSIPVFITEMYTQKPNTTLDLINSEMLFDNMAGIQNSKAFREHTDGNTSDLMQELYGWNWDYEKADANFCRQVLKNGVAKKLAQKLPAGSLGYTTFKEYQEAVSKIPAGAGSNGPAEGAPKKPKAKPVDKKPKSTGNDPRKGKPGSPADKRGDRPKKQAAPPAKAGGERPKGAGKAPAAKGTEKDAKSIRLNGSSIKLATLMGKVASAEKSGAKNVEHGGYSYMCSWLRDQIKSGRTELTSRFKATKPKPVPKKAGKPTKDTRKGPKRAGAKGTK
jgi:hypothetical protein